jgi:ElaB/YqjD/DUF883 family membrane-anchored ribosome-binding protein
MQNRLAEQFESQARRLASDGADASRSLLRNAQQVVSQSSDFIARHPGPCLAAAVAVGVLMGIWLKRR